MRQKGVIKMQKQYLDDGLAVKSSEKKQKQSSENGTILTMVVCVFCAICIWFYVMSVDSPTATDVFSSVPVTVQNIRGEGDADLTAISGTGSVIEVTLKGRKTLLNNIKPDTIVAYVDVSGVESAGRSTHAVVVEAPEGTVIEDYYPKEITVYLDKRDIKTVEVRCRLESYTVGAQYSLDMSTPIISPATINVKGPASELVNVEYAELVLSPGNITGSFKSSGALSLIDANGSTLDSRYLQLSVKEAEAAYTVYTTKTVPLAFDYKHGYFGRNGTKVAIEPAEITVRGQVERLAQLSSLTVATIDETKITANGAYTYALSMPQGVEIVADTSGNKLESVIATVSLGGYIGRVTVPSEEFVIKNDVLSGKSVTVVDTQLTVEVFGNGMSSMYLESDDVTVTVDVTGVGVGEQSVPATVSVRKGDSSSLYVVGTYSVWVRVEDPK